ncbi:purine-nucleoside phosphorylase [Sphaeroforma arctica JP610]|uniref:Purine nucleoside phosphorylase n=1 Tax=Sphaeroforma arctica JP610 TaxID=667725 RepID=A0A0L0G837_9EUKA|nr:purine-nucleoside phosphorylase [Sphaeroforma arctica JP610]KNC84413.1 purine-nucleoside phosphorylase [Sphaeroforma arctica JP610]|eukprot:XP_014158315.1 purine-nucleoside phosphorylase [Sphaeroforma arctica JP610]
MTSHQEVNPYTYELVQEIADNLLEKVKSLGKPSVLIICGSGLQHLSKTLSDQIAISYTDIPHFPVSTVEGHAGEAVFGKIGDTVVMCMRGRFHWYEGYSQYAVTLPVRVAKLMGAELLVVTNAAGGLNPKYNVGDIMAIEDHINWVGNAGNNPLRGPNDARWGPRFPATGQCYTEELLDTLDEVAQELGISKVMHRGTYMYNSGPCYETPAEARMLATFSDAVGMSTAPEAVIAHHCGMRCVGLTLVTNCVITRRDSHDIPTHDEVLGAANKTAKDMQELVTGLIKSAF